MVASADETLRALGRIADDLGPAIAPAGHDELLQAIVDTARRLFGAAACSLALVDEEEESLTFRVASGEGAEAVIGQQVAVGQGISGWVAASGQPMAVSGQATKAQLARDVAERTGYVPDAIVAMPMETERGLVGVISVLDATPGADGRLADMDVLAVFARLAALAIESQRVFASMASILFRAAGASAADGGDDAVARRLEREAEDATGPDPTLARLAAHVADLGRLGDAEKAAATALLGDFLAYARRRR